MEEKNIFNAYVNWRKSGENHEGIERIKYLHFHFRRQERLLIGPFFEDFFAEINDERIVQPGDLIELDLNESDDLPDFGSYEEGVEEAEPLFKKVLISEQDNLENDLIIGLATGESSAFEELYEDEYHKIEDYITNNSGSRTEAQDVFQDGVIILLEKIKTPGFEFTSRVGTYLYSCCRNIWLKQLRKSSRKINSEYYEYYPTTEVEFELEPDNLNEKLKTILDSLSESCLKLFKAFYYECKSWDVIANELGYITTSSAKNQKYKCLKKIQQ